MKGNALTDSLGSILFAKFSKTQCFLTNEVCTHGVSSLVCLPTAQAMLWYSDHVKPLPSAAGLGSVLL